MLPLICVSWEVGKQRQTAAELSKALFVWNWIGFCIVVSGDFYFFGHGVDVSRQPCIPSQAGNAGADRPHLAHRGPAETRTWGQSSRHAYCSNSPGRSSCCSGYQSSPPPLKSPTITGANAARLWQRYFAIYDNGHKVHALWDLNPPLKASQIRYSQSECQQALEVWMRRRALCFLLLRLVFSYF